MRNARVRGRTGVSQGGKDNDAYRTVCEIAREQAAPLPALPASPGPTQARPVGASHDAGWACVWRAMIAPGRVTDGRGKTTGASGIRHIGRGCRGTCGPYHPCCPPADRQIGRSPSVASSSSHGPVRVWALSARLADRRLERDSTDGTTCDRCGLREGLGAG